MSLYYLFLCRTWICVILYEILEPTRLFYGDLSACLPQTIYVLSLLTVSLYLLIYSLQYQTGGVLLRFIELQVAQNLLAKISGSDGQSTTISALDEVSTKSTLVKSMLSQLCIRCYI